MVDFFLFGLGIRALSDVGCEKSVPFSLAIDEGVCDMLDVTCTLEEKDGDDVPILVIQLGEGGFITGVEGVEDIFQWLVELCFVVIEGDDIRRLFGRWVVALIFGGLVLGDGCEVCFDICMEGGR